MEDPNLEKKTEPYKPQRDAKGRLKKGSSGNPRGRPKKFERGGNQMQFQRDWMAVFNEEFHVRIDGKDKKFPVIIVLLKQMLKKAIAGDAKLMFEVSRLYQAISSTVPQGANSVFHQQWSVEGHYIGRDRKALTDFEIEMLNKVRRQTREL